MRYSAAPARREALLRQLAESGYVSSSGAAAAMGVSEMTIRRDLSQLAAEGRVRRVVGGASLATGPEGGPGDEAGRGTGDDVPGVPFDERRTRATEEKRAVAAAAVPLVAGDAVLALDAGTTVAALARALPAGVTVVTHSLPVLTACAAREDLDVIALGGAYHRQTRSLTGPLTRAALGDLAVEVAVLSATAAGRAGVFSADPWDADTKRAMAAIAARVVLLLDHSKLEARAPMRVLGLDEVHTVVVDDRASAEQLALLHDLVAHVVVAPTPGTAG
ncbi:DeoR/GlpR family DNA-binding transcription regulator [Cellulomonas marina]|uniref:Lactose phosphotransferase system repressor n=1 Tax=Cellulomonas marina TaxID=988821 RepID=A0A1I1A558_9CELL|nr:DeoR/GlpR family DNA-binding transcription regulator [Cellulomonas marina]GIG29560.1 DeoR family transcriptional regulator [Cellulomonas marina]SFB33065.1 DNA-binding transcriptional regulator of sugar metabolism, DeoR/GlpR family [Cellulomonas marina]